MKRRFDKAGLVAAVALLLNGPVAAQKLKPMGQLELDVDPVQTAMLQELKRSQNLRLAAEDDLYFIEYSVDDSSAFSVQATLGGVVSRVARRIRVPRVQLRVGSYDFDNTNYVFTDFFTGGGRGMDHAPLGNDILALRSYFWLATDRAYKGALAAMARKRAALKSINLSEQLPDLAKVKPVVMVKGPSPQTVDPDLWTDRTRALSAIFVNYPKITMSSVRFESIQAMTYLASSEGAIVRYPETVHYLRIRAQGQAADGMLMRDAQVIQRLEISQVPGAAELESETRKVAEDLTALLDAPVGESYVGPVLFAGTAGAQLFAQLLGGNLAVPRRPVPEPGRNVPFQPSQLEGRIGSRVLPVWMNVVDDPTQTEYRGQPLVGQYPIDLEGVVPQPLRVIEGGTLKSYLLTRQPVKGFSKSNGRARLPGRFGANTAMISNLFVQANETLTEADLKQRLIELIEQRGKSYGILIRKLDFPSSASISELRRLSAGSRERGGGALLSNPILAFRVYPDGREELIRGLRFRGLSVRSLRDIIAASDESHLFNYLGSTAPLSLMGAGGYVTGCSVVAPSILVEDLELDPDIEELPKLPVVPPPDLVATQ